VLSTGKYLNVIQQCDKSAQWAALQSLEYLPNSEHYHPIIEKVGCVYLTVLNLKGIDQWEKRWVKFGII
jgi:hypothetical protein